MNFVSFLIEKFDFDKTDDDRGGRERESMKKFKATFGDNSFVVKGFKIQFSNHATHRYIERVHNDSKIFLLDQLKKVAGALMDKPDDAYHIKIDSINKGFIIKKTGRHLSIVTIYGDEMKNQRNSTVDLILESIVVLLDAITID